MLVAAIVIFSAMPLSPQDNFPDAPPRRWAYMGLAAARAWGVFHGYSGYGSGNKDGKGYATDFIAAGRGLSKLELRLRDCSNRLERDQPGSEKATRDISEANRLKKYLDDRYIAQILAAMGKAAHEFRSEIKALGYSPTEIEVPVAQFRSTYAHFHFPEVGSALHQFPDIPSRAWAAKDVAELRALGMLHGYPGDKFQG